MSHTHEQSWAIRDYLARAHNRQRGALQAYQAHAVPKGGMGVGMGCCAAFLLVVMGPAREEDAFWTLLALTHDRVPPTCVAEVGLFLGC